MDRFQISEKLKLEHLLFINKGYTNFHRIGPLGQFGLVVARSVCLYMGHINQGVHLRGCRMHSNEVGNS